MNTNAYLITCLTNLHVGAGGTNYDVIDNMVQRDPTTQMPTIFSSSLKGALREYFKNKWGENNGNLNYIFGADTDRNNQNESNIGHYKIFGADLLSIPVRSKQKTFFNATSLFLMQHINRMAKSLISPTSRFFEVSNMVEEGNPLTQTAGNVLEDWTSVGGLTLSNGHVGDNIALFHEKDFLRMASKLPVIARNKLVNGASKNLWYEEVVPRETRFVFFVSKEGDEEISSAFDQTLEDDVVQIGANGSIGYGFCKIQKIG